ncbi:MAG: hypothetical protein EB127_16380 [Alphaproteobacteria bacterium]|nr:hypothetical protein [Alphaproteobacteria bacterium]
MNLTRQMKDVENLYSEKVAFPPKGTFELAKDAKEKKKPFIGRPTGPEASVGFQKEISDPKELKGKETFQGTEKFSSENFAENTEKVEKNDQQGINTFMSKSIFDKLFEDVMGHQDDAEDAADLGLGAGDAGAEVSAEGDVTFTLPRDVAQKLHDVLMAALEAGKEEEGSTEEAEASGSEDAEHKAKKEEDEEEGEEEDNQEVAGEATELTAVPDSKGLALTGKNNKVGDETAKLVAKGEGDGKIKDGADGKLHPQKEVGATSPKGKANVVAGKASNVGHYLFQK